MNDGIGNRDISPASGDTVDRSTWSASSGSPDRTIVAGSATRVYFGDVILALSGVVGKGKGKGREEGGVGVGDMILRGRVWAVLVLRSHTASPAAFRLVRKSWGFQVFGHHQEHSGLLGLPLALDFQGSYSSAFLSCNNSTHTNNFNFLLPTTKKLKNKQRQPSPFLSHKADTQCCGFSTGVSLFTDFATPISSLC